MSFCWFCHDAANEKNRINLKLFLGCDVVLNIHDCSTYFVWLVVSTTRRFMFSLTFNFSPCSVLYCCYLVLFSIVFTSLGEERAGLCTSRAFVCLSCMRCILSLFSSFWCQRLACDYGTPWTVHLTFWLAPTNTIHNAKSEVTRGQ